MDLSDVPAEYLDLNGVFSKSRAASLPTHRPYDCIECISDSLAAKIIYPSSFPAGAGIFLVVNKDSSLRPCIDYRGLNNITCLQPSRVCRVLAFSQCWIFVMPIIWIT